MKVLLAYASKHGSTQEMADVMGEELRTAGLQVEVREVHEVRSLVAYDAAVLGSAIYMGNWMPDAKRFVYKHHDALVMMPVWMFSSGPIGDEPKPEGEPEGVASIMEVVQPREHVIFAGKLDKAHLNVGERIAVKLVGAPDGDFRDWTAVRTWARQIAGALSAVTQEG